MTTFPIYDPRRNPAMLPAREQTERVQREVDPDFYVMWETERKKWVVFDSRAPGGPEAQMVMVVQEPDGSFRAFDQRAIETIRKLLYGHDRQKEELRRLEQEREREVVRQRRQIAAGMAEDLKWFGRDVVPSTAWRDRSLVRERIREEAR